MFHVSRNTFEARTSTLTICFFSSFPLYLMYEALLVASDKSSAKILILRNVLAFTLISVLIKYTLCIILLFILIRRYIYNG